MDIRKLQRAIVDGLEDVKGQNIVVFNTEHLSPLFERVIIASATSNRQTKSLAASVRSMVKSRGMDVLRTEGEENGEWIIVDCGAAVAHIMQGTIREYYHLEEIWGDKPVKIKLESGKRLLPKASEDSSADDEDDDDDVDTAPVARPSRTPQPARKAVAARKTIGIKTTSGLKVAAKYVVPSKTSVKKTIGEPGTVAGKNAARKSAAKKVAAPAPGVTRTVGTKGGATSTTSTAPRLAAKKAVAVKTVASKTVGGKTVAFKAAAGKKVAGRKTVAEAPMKKMVVGLKRAPARKAAAKTAAPVGRSASPARKAPAKKAAPRR
ncbi:MAG: ribosome silencing factor RsfS [Rhizobacter sp.]|nr:ribosome silencing factor RsfS [Rhizobacter sp.]